jgi:hypothetical protein
LSRDRLRSLPLASNANDLPSEPKLLEPGDYPAARIECCFEATHACKPGLGNAWWLLCHDSPNESRLNSHTLRLSSDDLKFRRPRGRSIPELGDPERGALEPRERVELHDVHGLDLPLRAEEVLAMAG